MKSLSDAISELFADCIRLSEALQECFRQERRLLMEFKTEGILENNLTKDQLLRELVQKRHALTRTLADEFMDQLPEQVLDAAGLAQLKALQARWAASWNDLHRHCENNQGFLKHSLRNLERLSENLGRLFGLPVTYTAKGVRQDSKPQGNVVEGRY
jgi:hypothetical protein